MAFPLKGKAENFHPIPSIRRAREKSAMGKGDTTTDSKDSQHGEVSRTEVEKNADGTATVKAHHADGHVGTHHHPHPQAAQEHANSLMTGGPQAYDENHGDTDTDANAECPDCGGQIKNGVCTQCGYKVPEEAGESKEFEAGEKEGAGEY